MEKHNINVTHAGQVYAGFELSVLPLEAAIAAACQQIDQAGDTARLAAVGDPLRAMEYERAATEAFAFQAAGYKGEVPLAVASWADAKDITPQAAAENIMAKATTWNSALYAIRDARLKGKEATRKAENHEQVETLADAALGKLQDIAAQASPV